MSKLSAEQMMLLLGPVDWTMKKSVIMTRSGESLTYATKPSQSAGKPMSNLETTVISYWIIG
jgi:hypothetical protein